MSGRHARLRPSVPRLVLLLPLLAGITCAQAPARAGETRKAMKLHIEVQGRAITATLDDNPTARDFASLLPLELTLKDHNATEKVSDLPRRLSTDGAPAGADPSVSDIGYYAPWGNLAIYYRDFGYSSGLIKLGRIDSGLDVLSRPGVMKATIRRVGD